MEEPVEEIAEEEPVMEEAIQNILEEPVMEEPVEEIAEEEPVMEESIQNILEEPVMEEPVEEIAEEEPVVEEVQIKSAPKEDANLENMAYEVQKELMGLSIDINDDEIPEAIAVPPLLEQEEVKEEQSLDPSDLFKGNMSEEDDTELTDADLDMIESLEEEKKNPIEDYESVAENIEDFQNPEPVQDVKTEIGEDITEELQSEQEEPEEQGEYVLQESEAESELNHVSESEPESTEPVETETVETESSVKKTEVEKPQQETRQPSITEQILMEDAQRIAEEEANKPDPVEEQIEKPTSKKQDDKLETKTSQTPIVPVYSAEIPDEDVVESDNIQQGDRIEHAEFGRGIVEKIINYGERKLCSVNFEQVGRRLLDPKISEMKKI